MKWLGEWGQDLRAGRRLAARDPWFAATVMAVLAVGIGINAVVFSVFKGLAVAPLPGVPASAGLAVVVAHTQGGRQMPLSNPDYEYLRDHTRTFAGLVASASMPFTVGVGTDARRVWGEMVSGNYFAVLGAVAERGRLLQDADDAAGAGAVAVISHGLWQRVYGGDPGIIGQGIVINGQPNTVVGVVAAPFQGSMVGLVMDVFVARAAQPTLSPPNRLDQRAAMMWMVMGPPKRGVRIDAVATEIGLLADRLNAVEPVPDIAARAAVLPIWRSPYGAQTYLLPVVTMLGGIGIVVLLVVCANLANLVMARTASRRTEIATRMVLGGSRGRILRLLFAENVLLSVPGALGGILLAQFLMPLISVGASSYAPVAMRLNTAVDGWVLAFALGLAVVASVVCGLLPALRATQVSLREVGKGGTLHLPSRTTLRAVLVGGQVAGAVLLLTAAGTVLQVLVAARRADAGFDARSVASVAIDVGVSRDGAARHVFYRRLLDALAAEPDVEAASIALHLPLSLVDGPVRSVTIEGYQPQQDEDLAFQFNIVSDGYFRTLRIPVLAGREFARRDDAQAEDVVVVNETFARRAWGTASAAVGHRIHWGGGGWRTVVGVVRDLKYARLTESPRPYVYVPLAQAPAQAATVHVRGAHPQTDVVALARRQINRLDPDLAILSARLLEDQTRVALATYQLAAGTLVLYGAAALALAALGVYGLMSFVVRERGRETGLRLALGATRRDIVSAFLRRSVRTTAGGAAAGIALTTGLSAALGPVVPEIATTNRLVVIVAVGVVAAVATAATTVPAWKASAANPLDALRQP